MFAAWRYEQNGIDKWLSQNFSARSQGLIRSALVGLTDILLAPKECLQSLFYRPKFHVINPSLDSQQFTSATDLKQIYLKNCTEILYKSTAQTSFHEQHSHACRTVTDLSACVQGTPSLKDDIFNRATQVERLTRSGRQALVPERISDPVKNFVARPLQGQLIEDFGSSASGTYLTFPEFQKWHKATAPNTDKHPSINAVEPGLNPEGLRHFLNSSRR
ncbi:MAG: hypothetical protein IAF58_13395 [Leptolyngbya sp.]|nr:hypothetical protein [Candidatus Melainabacteria bacterium]